MSKVNKFLKSSVFIWFIGAVLFGGAIDNCVQFSPKLDNNIARKGEVITLTIDVKIDKGFHIYSTHPDKSLSPTAIEYADTTLFSKRGIVTEPSTHSSYDPNFDMDIYYHEGNIKLTQKLQLSENIQIGNHKIDATFVYFACDESKCIPKWDDFTFVFNIEDGTARTEFVSNIIEEYPTLNETSDVLPEELGDQVEKGILSFILFALGMGFLALLTPCVFPMIPITVSYFTKEGEKEGGKPFKSASIYALGIIIIFTSLGLILALTLGAAGANQIASSPWINLFIAGLFIYFAFSLFGHFEIQMPSAFRQFSMKQESRGGVIGILFMALTFTLTSFTCTVQFVGLLLVAASQGSFLWPALGMIAFATAFATPFFFLALFPQYLAKLPKSGGWLNSVKVTMGFLEFGAAMKFLSNSDLVWQWGIFTKQVVLATWVVISLLMGLYLLGKITLPHDTETKYIGVPRLVMSIIIMSFALYLSGGMFGQPLHGLIDSYLPPIVDSSREKIVVESGNKHTVEWFDTLEEALIESKNVNKPIFLDFTGYTCTNCRWMETNVFEDPQVSNLFTEFVLVRLYTDGGVNYRENQQMEIDRFGTAALPFYVVLDSNDEELARFPGMDPDVNKFAQFLLDAKQKYELEN
jgi:thiol:disulfide interchange protein DsbD